MKKALYSFGFILILLFVLELGIRLSGKLRTYSELNFNRYQSAYELNNSNKLFTWIENSETEYIQAEFTYTYQTNQFGLIDQHNLDTCDRNNTIIYLGDSFAFGIGSNQGANIPTFLEDKIGLTVVNAGISGSDPFFEKQLMDSIFLKLGFRKYVYMLNFSDLYDYVIRGGEERFQPNGVVQYQGKPWFEPLYQHSFGFRAIIHFVLGMDFSLKSANKVSRLKSEGVVAYGTLFSQINTALQDLDGELVVVLQPYPRQYKADERLSNILDYSYLEKLETILLKNKIQTINLDPLIKPTILKDGYLKYSWELDGHYNEAGYQLLADEIAKQLKSKYPNFVESKSIGRDEQH